jgi:AcrB/AcrD/AcrF family
VWLSGGDNTCKNAILKVEFAHEIEQQGRGAVAAAIEAARLRLRPILMTSFAFIMGVVPLVLSSGAGAEMRHAMGVAVFSGMLGVTFFGLFLTPVFYVLLRGVEKRVAKRAAADGIQSDTAAHFLRVNLIDPPLNERTERFRRQRPRPADVVSCLEEPGPDEEPVTVSIEPQPREIVANTLSALALVEDVRNP